MSGDRAGSAKISWTGQVIGVQPRIKMRRIHSRRDHSYPGYALWLRGTIGDQQRSFVVAIGKGAHAKHSFGVGDHVQGLGLPVANPDTEIAELYKVSGLSVTARHEGPLPDAPPYLELAPDLPSYRARGHQRLDEIVFLTRCGACRWGCEMVVEVTPDPSRPAVKFLRRETFCYGPKNCACYVAGPNRVVPGRDDDSWTEPDSVDADETKHRE